MQKEVLLDILAQNRMTCSFAFNKVTPDNANWKLNDQAASIGFIYRHIGETINLFGWFFGIPVNVENTTMGQTYTGQGQDVAISRQLVEQGYETLQRLLEETPDSAWLEPIQTPFFGIVSKARLFAHILFHNAHHAGQISLTLSKGQA